MCVRHTPAVLLTECPLVLKLIDIKHIIIFDIVYIIMAIGNLLCMDFDEGMTLPINYAARSRP